MSPRADNTNIFHEESPLISSQANESQHHTIRQELCKQLETALPTLQSMVLTKIPWLISLRFVGGIGAAELAAAALATTLSNVTGLSLSVGLSSALSTLAGQAKGDLLSRGATNPSQVNTTIVFLLRGMVLQLLFVLPMGIWWLSNISSVLVQLGQPQGLSEMTAVYLQVLAPGLWGYSINWTLTAWVQAIGMPDVPAHAAVLGLILHIPFNWFFIDVLDMGYIGSAVATVCFQVIQPLFVTTYLFGFDHGRRRVLESTGGLLNGHRSLSFWKELRIAVSTGYVQYLGLALPGIIIISEWWASETAIFLSGRLEPSPEIAVGGMTIYQSINTFCFMFPVAFSIAASTRVSNLLGADRPTEAAFAGRVSIGIAGLISLTLGVLLYSIPHTLLPSFFAPNEDELIEETSRTIPLLATYVVADGIQVALNGIIKGCGRQCITMPIVVVAYWVVALPLAYYFAFVKHNRQMFCDDSYFCGDVGLVAGMTSGTWVHMLLLAVVVGATTNWNLEAKKAKERVANH